MDALGFLSKASTKFFHEVAPVALASVIGTMLVNHYSHRVTAPSVVVQPPPDALLQTLHHEHQLIVDYLKRDAETKQAVSVAESLPRSRQPLQRPRRVSPSRESLREKKLRPGRGQSRKRRATRCRSVLTSPARQADLQWPAV